jgi:hypothetical protein
VPVPTSTRTPTPTATPPAGGCLELVQNGGFEDQGGWTIANTAYRARYSATLALAGRRSLQVGIAEAGADRASYSSAEQRITVPAGLRAKLRVSYNLPRAGGSSDWGYVLIRPAGGAWRVVRILRGVTDGWASLDVDVSHYAGSAFVLRVGVRNDGRSGGPAVMYVDQVSVEACPR